MLARPAGFTGCNLFDGIPQLVTDRDCQRVCARRRLDLVAILPAVARELNIVEDDKELAARDLFEIAQPRQVVRLMDSDQQLEDEPQGLESFGSDHADLFAAQLGKVANVVGTVLVQAAARLRLVEQIRFDLLVELFRDFHVEAR